MAVDLLKKATSKVARQAPKAKTDERPVLILTDDEYLQVAKLIELATINGEISPLVEQHKKSVSELLFNYWSEQMWSSRRQPENPRIIIHKKDAAGKNTAMEDMKCLLQVKFREAALQTVLPDAADLPDGQTLVEHLIEHLTSDAVGLSEANATKFVNEEIVITDRVMLAKSLDQLFYSTDKAEKSIGTKLLTFINARDEGKKQPKLPLLTDDEASQLLVTKQIVTMKEGLFQRACQYCDDVGQLRKLLMFVRPVIQVATFEFGISDEPPVRIERMQKAVATYLMPANC